MKTCGFCHSEVPDQATLCKECGAYKLRKSYKVDKLIQACAGGLLVPIAAAGAYFIRDMYLPKILYGLTVIVALLGIYFIFAARRILVQWDYWHRR